MSEFRRIREQYGILDIIEHPELAVEVTMQPIRAFAVDVAIIFSDILPVLSTLGLRLEYVAGRGPVIENPLRTASDIERLPKPDVENEMHNVFEAIRLARRALDGKVPLLGFSGSPFTLATYAIEGESSTVHLRTKELLFHHPESWHALMAILSSVVARYVTAQIRHGAEAIQIFDSWAGSLSPHDYREHVFPYTRDAIRAAQREGVPVIFFSTGTSGWLETAADLGADVTSIDWRIDLAGAWDRIGSEKAIQGNLDPAALLGPWSEVRQRAEVILDQAAGRAGHIFNLGHGVLPATPEDNVRALVDFVHERTLA